MNLKCSFLLILVTEGVCT